MRIAHKKTVDKQVVGECQAHLDKQRAIAAAAAKERRELRKATGAKAGEGCVAAWGRDAVLNAVMQYGPEVMSDKGYWDDMKRRYPEACADDRVPGTDSVNGHRNKFGRVSKRFVGGRWYVWKGGKWVAEGENVQRRGAEAQL